MGAVVYQTQHPNMHKLALLLLCAGGALAQYQCQEDGFYVDPQQCDKYYDCYRGQQTEKLCPDGLVFDHTLGPKVEQCNYPFIVECPAGSALQPAQSAGIQCPRQNGYFEHEDPSNCLEYYECVTGISVLRKCAMGLVFDEFTGTCQWATAGLRSGCVAKTEVLNGFSCPNATQVAANGAEYDHARYLNPDDCRYFYVCEDGMHPREIGCPQGTVFNDLSLLCDDPANVPGCENYYPADQVSNPVNTAGLGRF